MTGPLAAERMYVAGGTVKRCVLCGDSTEYIGTEAVWRCRGCGTTEQPMVIVSTFECEVCGEGIHMRHGDFTPISYECPFGHGRCAVIVPE